MAPEWDKAERGPAAAIRLQRLALQFFPLGNRFRSKKRWTMHAGQWQSEGFNGAFTKPRRD